MSEDEILLTHILQCKPIDLLLHKPVLTAAQQEQFDAYKHRRALGEPLQYILGSWDFMGLALNVNPSVLVPRPETEQMVESAINLLKRGHMNVSPFVKVLDLGTGSGCIAIALAKFCSHVQVTTVDISKAALDLAQANAKKHGVDGRIAFVQADMFKTFPIFVSFDMIISNPPYVPSDEMAHLPQDVQQEPALALDGGRDGLDFYRAIIKYTPDLLRPGGYLMMEFGDGQEQAILSLFDTHFKVDVFEDLAGRPRFLTAQFE